MFKKIGESMVESDWTVQKVAKIKKVHGTCGLP